MSNDFNNKRYYWIKLKDSFMTSDKVDYLMSQKNGANYIVLYQMLCLKAINTDGELARQVGEILMPFDAEKIQRDCKWFDIDTVRVALELYKNLGLVFIQESGILKITDFENLVGSETQSNIYKKNKQLENFQPNSNKRLDIRDKDIRDKNTDKDIPPLYISPPEGENVSSENPFLNRFKIFWSHYPRKEGKGNCEKWFTKNKPSAKLLDTMVDAIEVQKQSEKWTKNNGQFIPMPATWLNQKRWEDELALSVDKNSLYDEDDENYEPRYRVSDEDEE